VSTLSPAGLQALPFQPIPLADFRRRVLALYTPPLMSRSSFANMRLALDQLVALLGEHATTGALTTGAIAAFVHSRHGKENPNTTRTRLGRISSACNIALAEGWIRFNPVSVRRRWIRGVSPKRPRVHSREEIARVLALARAEAESAAGWEGWRSRRLHALVALVAYTGVRKMEALTLQVGDVDLAERMIYLTARQGGEMKTEASAEPVPIPEDLLEVLERWIADLRNPIPAGLPGRPHFHRWLNRSRSPAGDQPWEEWLFPNSFRSGPWTGGSHKHRPCDCLQRLGRRAGIPGLTFQSLRHSWSTHAEYWGLTDLQIQRVLRHTNTRTQRIYRHAEAANLRAMVTDVAYPVEPPDVLRDQVHIVRAKGERLTDAQAAELVELRQQGWRYEELEARFGCSSATIARACKRLAAGAQEPSAESKPTAHRHKWWPLTPEQSAEIVELRQQGWTVPELAARFNCARATIYSAMSRVCPRQG